jgi:hypothetical protein
MKRRDLIRGAASTGLVAFGSATVAAQRTDSDDLGGSPKEMKEDCDTYNCQAYHCHDCTCDCCECYAW